ncbi:MAG: Nif11 family protein [Sphingomonas sp.]
MTQTMPHRFLAAVRDDPGLRAGLPDPASGAGLEELAAFARAAGFAVDAGGLRAAWRQDWALWSLAKGSAAGKRDASSRASTI